MARARERPGRISRWYAWALLAVHPFVPVAWVAIVVAATLTLPSLGSAGSAPLEDLVAEDSPALAAQARSAELFGAPLATDTVIVQRNPQGLTQEESEAFARAVGGVATGQGPEGIAAALPAANLSVGPLQWNEERTTALAYLAFGADLNLEERRDAAERFVGQLEPAPGARAGQTGPAPARLAQYDAIVGALPFITLGSILLIALIVGVHFRSWTAPLVTLAAAAIAYGVSLHVLGWAGERAAVVMPREVEPVIVVLILGLVTDYAVFYLSAFRDAWGREGGSRFAAMRAATAGTSRVVLTAGVIVAAGTASLVAGELDFFRAFGPGLAITALISVAVCLTFIPACLALLGRRLAPREAPARPAPVAEADASDPTERLPEPLRVRLAGRLSALHSARRAADEHGLPRRRVVVARIVTAPAVAVPIVIACCAALLLAASGVRQLELGMTLVPSLPPDDPARVAGEDARQGFAPGVTAPVEIVLERRGIGEELGALGELQERLRDEPGVAAVVGPQEERGALGDGVAVTGDGGAARLAVLLDHEPGSATAIDAVDRLESRLPALIADAGLGTAVPQQAAGTGPDTVAVGVSGETALGGDTVNAVVDDLWRIAVVALGLNLLLLVLFMRALVAPLYLLAASVLGYAAGLGLTVLLFQGVLGYDGLTYYVPLATAVLLVSLGSDYNVFVAGRIWAEARTRRLREAVAVATPQAAGAVTVAGITLAASFALLALVPLRSFREFALLMVVGVLIDTLLVRSLLIPGLVSIFGEWSWWPGRRVDPPPHRELIAAVARHRGSADELAAERAMRATLATLAERITRREAKALCTQLPGSYRTDLFSGRGHARGFGLEEFLARVSEREGGGTEVGALDDARAVLATLAEVVDETTMGAIRAQLGDDAAPLMDETPERRFEREIGLPDLTPPVR
ncbi:MAG TPA: MMPL family transporter [Solirubrobacteraceae bacterium]|nr:MMPL family transporter [Solirubrobacteraceae bacterium]